MATQSRTFSSLKTAGFVGALVVAAGAANASSFTYTDFNSVAGLTLNGTAQQTPGLTGEPQTVSLTLPVRQSVGTMYATDRQPVNLGFTTQFQFRIRDRVNAGSDGLTFIIQNAGVNAMGGAGGALGYATNLAIQTDSMGNIINQGIPNSVAIAFDTWDNTGDWPTIPGGNILSVQTRGLLRNTPDSGASLGGAPIPGSFNDGAIHTVRITYVPGLMSIFYDNLVTPALSVPLNLSNTLSLTSGSAFVGFTAATGGFTQVQRHEILNWSFSGVIPAPGAAALLGLGGLLATRRRRAA
jgi:hypothetical protein